MKNILVTGATGPQGRAVAEHLLQAGFNVRAIARDTAKAGDLARLGAEVVHGDLNDPECVENAMKGQDGVFLTIGYFDGTHEQAKTVIDAAAREKVGKIVWNVAGVVQDLDTGNPAVDKWRPILSTLQQSGIPHVVLESTVYMENMLVPAIVQEVVSQGTLAYPMPTSVHCQGNSHQDAAAYAVSAFQQGSNESFRIRVGGPERLTGDEIADRFGKVLGRSIRFRQMPADEFAQALGGGNVEAIVGYYRAVADNPDMMSTDLDHGAAIERLPVRPLSFESWVDMYREAFTSPTR